VCVREKVVWVYILLLLFFFFVTVVYIPKIPLQFFFIFFTFLGRIAIQGIECDLLLLV